VRLEPDVIVPARFLPQPIATPERRLLLAVLEEAVGTYQRYIMANDRRGHRLLADVDAWFACDDTQWPYSFVTICDALGLDPTYVRCGLALWAESHRSPSGETAPEPLYRFPFRRVGGTRTAPTARRMRRPSDGSRR
jgi:hypothetical protein